MRALRRGRSGLDEATRCSSIASRSTSSRNGSARSSARGLDGATPDQVGKRARPCTRRSVGSTFAGCTPAPAASGRSSRRERDGVRDRISSTSAATCGSWTFQKRCIRDGPRDEASVHDAAFEAFMANRAPLRHHCSSRRAVRLRRSFREAGPPLDADGRFLDKTRAANSPRRARTAPSIFSSRAISTETARPPSSRRSRASSRVRLRGRRRHARPRQSRRVYVTGTDGATPSRARFRPWQRAMWLSSMARSFCPWTRRLISRSTRSGGASHGRSRARPEARSLIPRFRERAVIIGFITRRIRALAVALDRRSPSAGKRSRDDRAPRERQVMHGPSPRTNARSRDRRRGDRRRCAPRVVR